MPSSTDTADDARYLALKARDARFDGRFFTGVTSTGIYCRCICPARLPKRTNRTFWPSAAAAEAAGFRPCLLCRPERAPGLAPIDAPARLASQAYARIEAGALEDAYVIPACAVIDLFGSHPEVVTGSTTELGPSANRRPVDSPRDPTAGNFRPLGSMSTSSQ